ncbi:hypothetical protein D3C80_2067570 [compost metagenome]
MGQHHIQLRGGVAQGLRNAAGAVVADQHGGDLQFELFAQLEGLQVAERSHGQAGQKERD